MLLKLVAACLLACAVTERVTVNMHPDKSGRSADPMLDCEKLSNVIHCDDPAPVKLGSGAHAQTWLVKGRKTGSLDVLKVLFVPEEHEDPRKIATLADLYNPSDRLVNVVREASLECNYAQHFRAVGKEGSKYVMSCLGTNIGVDPRKLDRRSRDTPLWSMMSFCGSETIKDFMQRIVKEGEENSVDVFRKTFKQILLGVNLLATAFRHVAIHHDLKHGNIMVKTTEGQDGKPHHRAYLIDFGSTVMDDDDICKVTSSTNEFAPSEWSRKTETCPQGQNLDASYPWAFDVFSLGAIYVELLTGIRTMGLAHEIHKRWCYDLFTVWCADGDFAKNVAEWSRRKFDKEKCKLEERFCTRSPDPKMKVFDAQSRNVRHDFLDHVVSDQEFFVPMMKLFVKDIHKEGPNVEFYDKVMNDKHGKDFMRLILNALKFEPSERPTTEDMLHHPWMDAVQLDTFDIEAAETAKDVMQQVKQRLSTL